MSTSKSKLPPISSVSNNLTKKKSSRKSISSKNSRRNSSSRSLGSAKKSASINTENVVEEAKSNIINLAPVNYKEEIIYQFFSSMLESTFEEYNVVLEPEMPESKIIPDKDTSEKSFKEVTAQDLMSSEIISARGSNVLLIKKNSESSVAPNIKKSEKSLKTNSQFIKSSSKLFRQDNTSRLTFKSTEISKTSTLTQKTEENLDWIISPNEENVEIYFKNGNFYKGSVSRKLMNSYGTFIWSDGTSYEGEFKDGLPTGNGKMVLKDLAAYEGGVCNGDFHGYGVFNITETPSIYCGDWKDGKKHGKGWLLHEPNEWYDGEWINGTMTGSGFRRYKNGSVYKGEYLENLRDGQGSYLFENSDFYKGTWQKGLMNGYGEYTWNTYLGDSLTYSLNSWYKGAWISGLRNGAGIMSFGSESGTKLAGVWNRNLKNGPGVMICGNGICMQSNPLFINDKPITYQNKPQSKINFDDSYSINNSNLDPQNSFMDILTQINKKVPKENIDAKILSRVTKSGENISRDKFIGVTDANESNAMNPLEIPIHNISEKVDLSFYIDKVLDFFKLKLLNDNSSIVFSNETTALEEESLTKNPEVSRLNYLSLSSMGQTGIENESVNESDDSLSTDLSRNVLVAKNVETNKMENAVLLHLSTLTGIYKKYASMTSSKPTEFRPVLIRLFLWQFFRDIEITSKGLSLIEIDEYLASNPNSYFETVHGTFELIYFWQFLQAIVGTACLLYFKNGNFDDIPKEGCLSFIFKKFITENILNKEINFNGKALTELKDVLPIQSVYKLYLDVGEGHTARDFLKNTCTRKGYNPLCSLDIRTKEKENNLSKGYNMVPLNYDIFYINSSSNVLAACKESEEEIMFSKTLYKFNILRPKRIMQCLVEVCPQIMEDGVIVYMDYQLSFLEFYEVLLLCALKLINMEAKQEQRKNLIDKILNEMQNKSTLTVG